MDNKEKPPVSKKVLEKLYFKDNLTTRKIGKELKVTKTTILRWFKKYKIIPKNAIESRHYTGFRIPSKETLYIETLIQGKTFRELGKKYKCDPTTIMNWIKAYNLPRPASYEKRRGLNFKEPSKKQLEKWYLEQKMSTVQIGELINLSGQSISSRLKNYNIPVRYSGFNFKRYECEDGHIVKSIYEKRVDDWLFIHHLEHHYEPPCPFNHRQKADFKVKDFYIEVWGITSKEYKKKKSEKRKHYKQNNIKLIQIYPADRDYRLHKKLKLLLSKNDRAQVKQLSFNA